MTFVASGSILSLSPLPMFLWPPFYRPETHWYCVLSASRHNHTPRVVSATGWLRGLNSFPILIVMLDVYRLVVQTRTCIMASWNGSFITCACWKSKKRRQMLNYAHLHVPEYPLHQLFTYARDCFYIECPSRDSVVGVFMVDHSLAS